MQDTKYNFLHVISCICGDAHSVARTRLVSYYWKTTASHLLSTKPKCLKSFIFVDTNCITKVCISVM